MISSVILSHLKLTFIISVPSTDVLIIGDRDIQIIKELYLELKDDLRQEIFPRNVNVRFEYKPDVMPEDLPALIAKHEDRAFSPSVVIFQTSSQSFKLGHSAIDVYKRTTDSIQLLNTSDRLHTRSIHTILPLLHWFTPKWVKDLDWIIQQQSLFNKACVSGFPYFVKPRKIRKNNSAFDMDGENPTFVPLSKYVGAAQVLASILRDLGGSQGWLVKTNWGSNILTEWNDSRKSYFNMIPQKKKEDEKHNFVQGRELLVNELAKSVRQLHPTMNINCLMPEDAHPSEVYDSLSYYTQHPVMEKRFFLANIASFSNDMFVKQLLESRDSEIGRDGYVLKQLGNKMYDYLMELRKSRPSPNDVATEEDLQCILPEIFGTSQDYNVKPC